MPSDIWAKNMVFNLGFYIKKTINQIFSSVQSLSHVRLFATPWIAARQASLSITISQSSLKLRSIESVMPFSHLILCHPLFLLLPAIGALCSPDFIHGLKPWDLLSVLYQGYPPLLCWVPDPMNHGSNFPFYFYLIPLI